MTSRLLIKSASSVLAGHCPPHHLGGVHKRAVLYSARRETSEANVQPGHTPAPTGDGWAGENRVRFASSRAAALLDGLSEQPSDARYGRGSKAMMCRLSRGFGSRRLPTRTFRTCRLALRKSIAPSYSGNAHAIGL